MSLPEFLRAGKPRHYGEILSLFGCEGDRDCYVLGVHEGRVTVLSQQSRALNLAWALKQAGGLAADGKRPARIAVVGAGAGGLTAAAALACEGADVTLIGSSELMQLQAGCTQRWLHPFIYDWPNDNWYRSRAELPILDWSAGRAEDVRDEVIRGFEAVERSTAGRLQRRLNTEVLALERAPKGGYRLHLRDYSGTLDSLEASTVVFTVGFGLEDEPSGLPANAVWQSYWKTDLVGGSTGDVLVSGDGDGGLTDVLRCALKNFEHSELLELAGFDASTERERDWVGEVKERILEFEANLTVGRVGPSSLDFYRDDLHGDVDELDDRLVQSLNRDVAVTLNAGAHPLRATASALNRLIVGRLLKLSETRTPVVSLTRVFVDLAAVRPPRSLPTDANGALVIGGFPNAFDKVVIRHGTIEPRPIRAFPITATMAPTLRNLPLAWALDQSRLQAWDDETAFRACTADEPPRIAQERVETTRSPPLGSPATGRVDLAALASPTRQIYLAVLLAHRYEFGSLDIASVERITGLPAWQVARLVDDDLKGLAQLQASSDVVVRLSKRPAELELDLQEPRRLADDVFADLVYVHGELGYEVAAVGRRELPSRRGDRLRGVHGRLRFAFWYGIARGSLETDHLLTASLDAWRLAQAGGEQSPGQRDLVEIGLWAVRRVLRRGAAGGQREAVALLGRWHLLEAIHLVPAAPRNNPAHRRPMLSGELIAAFAALALSDEIDGEGFSRATRGVRALAKAAAVRGEATIAYNWDELVARLDQQSWAQTVRLVSTLGRTEPPPEVADYVERVTGLRPVDLTFDRLRQASSLIT